MSAIQPEVVFSRLYGSRRDDDKDVYGYPEEEYAVPLKITLLRIYFIKNI